MMSSWHKHADSSIMLQSVKPLSLLNCNIVMLHSFTSINNSDIPRITNDACYAQNASQALNLFLFDVNQEFELRIRSIYL